MSIVVNGLTKVYDDKKAIDQLSFNVQKGDILGFLGPNGAGKTTTMKILTCFIPQTSGHAEICGIDTLYDSIEVRKKIGYLPENNPLYKDMYIREYLDYVAHLYNLKDASKRIDKMIEITGLGDERKKKISQISKGYKQRVGLAQAMIHDPEVLIMDEPTSGLDPNQLVEIRQVIREIGKEKSVILSSHIMQEVEALCNRVIIINKGLKIFDDDITSLNQINQGKQIVSVQFSIPPSNPAKIFGTIPDLIEVQQNDRNDTRTVQFHSALNHDLREQIFDTSVRNGLKIIGMSVNLASMEEVFHQLTQTNK